MGLAANVTSPTSGTPLGEVASGLYAPAMKMAEKHDADVKQGIQKIESEVKPTPPTLTEAPKPENYHTDPMQEFGSGASFLAMFGSLLTKQPLTTALNSGAAVMQAKNAQDANGFKQAMDKWKVDTENAWKMANWQQEVYKAAISKDETELKLQAASFKDEVMLHMADAKMVQQAIKDRDRELKRAQGPTQRIIEMSDAAYDQVIKNGGTQEEANKAALKAFGEGTALSKGKDSTSDPQEYEEWKKRPRAKLIAEGIKNGVPITNLIRGRGKDADKQLGFAQDYAKELYPDLDLAKSAEDYKNASKAVSAFGTGKQGDAVKSFNVAYNHADLVSQLATALGNGDVQKINQWGQAYEEEFGSPAPTNFDAAKTILADEINKAAVGGAGALADREKISDTIKRAESPEQFKGAIDTYKGLIVGQMDGMKRQYKNATKRDDFDTLLSPDVAEDLKKYEKRGSMGKAGKPPDKRHIKMLKDDPSEQNKEYFDEAFGKGAAAKALSE